MIETTSKSKVACIINSHLISLGKAFLMKDLITG